MPPDDSTTDHLLSRSSSDGALEPSDDQFVERPRWQHLLWTRHQRTCCNPSLKTRHRLSSKFVRTLILLLNSAAIIISVLIVISILDAILYPSYAYPPAHYQLLEYAVQSSSHPGRGNPNSDKIFIASNIINADLIQGHWGNAMLQLIDYLGPGNVFVSIYENDSGPNTVAALTKFAQKLPCNHSVTTGAHVPLSDLPSVIIPTGEARTKRLTYLYTIRNRLLLPLDPPSSSSSSSLPINHTSTRFTYILFVNDIIFEPTSALHLLFSTHLNPATKTPDYDVACAADFIGGVQFYDSFVVRDSQGYGMGLQLFPWFAPVGASASRRAVLKESDAVPVRSCWGGMVSYRAGPFLRGDDTDEEQDEKPPLRFRHQSELYWEESECCLVNADLAARRDPEETKIFLNPYVRVAYGKRGWWWLPFVRRFEHVFSILQYCVSKVAYPEFNPRRVEIPGRPSTQLRWVYNDDSFNGEMVRNLSMRVEKDRLEGRWKMVEEIAEPGGFCGQRRLFLMKKDLKEANGNYRGKNWEKGPFPRIK